MHVASVVMVSLVLTLVRVNFVLNFPRVGFLFRVRFVLE